MTSRDRDRNDPTDYPVNLLLAGKSVLVVGAGRVAARKVNGLLGAGALVTVVAPDVDAALSSIESSLVAIERRPYTADDLEGAWFVVEATGDPDVSTAVHDDAEAAGIFCNAADQPAACSATLPAVHRQGALSVTFSTGGVSPALSAWLRGGAGEIYGPEYAELAVLLGEARDEARRAGRGTEALDWRGVLDSGILEEIRSGRISRAKERLEAWLSSSSE